MLQCTVCARNVCMSRKRGFPGCVFAGSVDAEGDFVCPSCLSKKKVPMQVSVSMSLVVVIHSLVLSTG